MYLKYLLRYDWIALLDVDEVIVPRKHNSWAEMMEEVRSYLIIFDHIWLYLIIFDHIWPFSIIFDHIWPYLTIFDHIWSYLIILDHLWSYLIIFDHIWSYLIIFDHIRSYLIIFDHIWPYIWFQVGPDANKYSGYTFTNIYFLDNMTDNLPQPNLHKDVPAGLHIMNHVYR